MRRLPRYASRNTVAPFYDSLAWRERYNPLPDLTPERTVELYCAWRDPVAQFQRGRMYQEGEGELRDSELADEWFHKAVPGLKKEAQDGGREAAFCLYECFRKGLGVEKDDARALFWLQRAAEQGEPVAMFTLALEYREGGLVQKDDDLFMYWLRRAAEEGNEEDAQYLLASCYEHGNGVPQDVNLARKWYDRAEHQRVSGSGAPRERTKGE